MVRRNVIAPLFIILSTILGIVLCVPLVEPARTWCVVTFDGNSASYLVDMVPLIAAVFALVTPVWFIHEFLKQEYTVSEFLMVIFSTYILSIVLFAMIFYSFGIIDTSLESVDVSGVTENFFDYIYYSAVTFTTLGYGDFKPCAAARLYAAGEALLGGFFLPFSSAVVLARVIKDSTSTRNATPSEPSLRTLFPWQVRGATACETSAVQEPSTSRAS